MLPLDNTHPCLHSMRSLYTENLLSIELKQEISNQVQPCQSVKPHCLRQIYYFGWSRGLWQIDQQEKSNLSIGMCLIEHTKQLTNQYQLGILCVSAKHSPPISLSLAPRCSTQYVRQFVRCIVVPCRLYYICHRIPAHFDNHAYVISATDIAC